jgi:putative ABC transport system ATP-binding protein
MIELIEVRRTYHKDGHEVRALDGVSIAIAHGEFVAVTGPSGSGKSTLMNVIGLLDRPDAGQLLLDGVDVGALPPDALATLRNERIGFVFQTFHLLARTTALENVELPLVYSARRHTRGLGLRALERVGLGDRATHHPNELSGGQQQRVAIARALVQEPALILADEPTGNLDSKSSGEIMSIFRELNAAGTTIVVVTHDAAIAEHADRRIEIVDGRIRSDSMQPRTHGSGQSTPPVSFATTDSSRGTP